MTSRVIFFMGLNINNTQAIVGISTMAFFIVNVLLLKNIYMLIDIRFLFSIIKVRTALECKGVVMREYFLKTKRIGFSRWTKDDIDLAILLWGQPEVTKFICANGVFTEQEIKNRLTTELENYKVYKVQYFPIFDLNTSDIIGCCGLRPYEKKDKVYEMGIHLRKEYWKQGLAFEAADAMIDFSFSTFKVKELRAGHHPLNTSSKNLLLKLGFEYIKDCFYEPTGLYHPLYSITDK